MVRRGNARKLYRLELMERHVVAKAGELPPGSRAS